MQSQFVVPQFLEVESTIIGAVTMRQFGIVMISVLICAVFYRLFDFALFLTLAIPWMLATLVLAFAKINGQPFHYFLVNVVQTMRRPGVRVWNKERLQAELRATALRKVEVPPPLPERKASLTSSRLRDLSLVVNTGGAYVPDDAK
jgi:hypothetical protein